VGFFLTGVILLVFFVVVGIVILIFVGTGIPLLVLGIRRANGHRSRKSKIAMIVLGIVWGLATLCLVALVLWSVLPCDCAPPPGTTG
jgi:hypothetical protein